MPSASPDRATINKYNRKGMGVCTFRAYPELKALALPIYKDKQRSQPMPGVVIYRHLTHCMAHITGCHAQVGAGYTTPITGVTFVAASSYRFSNLRDLSPEDRVQVNAFLLIKKIPNAPPG